MWQRKNQKHVVETNPDTCCWFFRVYTKLLSTSLENIGEDIYNNNSLNLNSCFIQSLIDLILYKYVLLFKTVIISITHIISSYNSKINCRWLL